MSALAPPPGTKGAIVEHNGLTYFWAENGDVWRLDGAGSIPVTPDTAHVLAEDLCNPQALVMPQKPMPFTWPDGVDDESASAPTVKSQKVYVNSRDRRNALRKVLDELCKNNNLDELEPDRYASNITQSEMCEILEDKIGTRHGTSSKSLRDDLEALGVSIKWNRARNKR